MAATSIPDDLLLIMQSYVDPIPRPMATSSDDSRPAGEAPQVQGGEVDDEWSEGEDDVEATILVESDDEDPPEDSNLSHNHALPPANEPPDDGSSSDSDLDSSSSSSSGVEMRVTRYPASKSKHLDSLTVLVKPTDSDAEDEDGAPHTLPAQYSGTKNEILVPEVEVPEITEVPVDDVLEPIGEIMTIIDSVVVVKGDATGVRRALDMDSLLVFEDRKVLGKVFETFGAVKQPLYSVRFPSASAIDKNIIWIGRPVLHVPARSNFVFAEAIARLKGSDASNLHDEEVGEDQMDFSDDEAEAQWRRNRKEAKREQTSSHSYTRSPPRETTPRQPRAELPALLPYPAGDDGDVPYSTLPYDDVPDPRPAPAAYDPYSDHEEAPKPALSLPPRPQPPSPRQNRNANGLGGSRGRGKDRGRGGGNRNQPQNRRERKNTGPGERGRPNRGRDGRGRGRGGRQNHGHGTQGNYSGELSPTSRAIAQATGQYSSTSYTQDDGYNPMNASTGLFESDAPAPGTMPHINPRFFSGDMAGPDMSAFGLSWGDMGNMAGYGYGYQQPGFGYSGYGQADQMGYNQGFGWLSEEPYPSHGQYDQSGGPHGDTQGET
ncbi:hypothetical protein FRC10_010095 [Ceratobasidium sp. 414]|nr:hypothetical protein FRC10_010095 [Ceratobasidium sp. 414]